MKTLLEIKQQYLSEAEKSPVGGYLVKDRNGKVVAHSESEFVHCFTDKADEEWAINNGYSWKQETIDGRVLTWISAMKNTSTLFRSADGNYYSYGDLPEQQDAFVTERYASEVRAERNARISDTDDYVKLTDMTVKKEAKSAREALTESERAEVMTYREALRDLPTVQGFPFVDYPTMPACIAYECGQKADARAMQAQMYRGF